MIKLFAGRLVLLSRDEREALQEICTICLSATEWVENPLEPDPAAPRVRELREVAGRLRG